MNAGELGRRIKEARIAKRLTQAEVVGDFITRNMLSQIESGSAMPSVKTLQYLSRVLEVPMSQLMPEEESGAEGAAEYLNARELFSAGEFSVLLDKPVPCGFEDEMNALLAKASLELAREESGSPEKLPSAAEHAKQAAHLAELGIYSNQSVKTEALLLLNSIAAQLAEHYKSLIDSELREVMP